MDLEESKRRVVMTKKLTFSAVDRLGRETSRSPTITHESALSSSISKSTAGSAIVSA